MWVVRVRQLAWAGALIALGILVGGAAATLRTAQQVHQLLLERDALTNRVGQLAAQLQKLEQSLDQRRRRPVRGLEVLAEGLDPAERMALEREVRALLEEFVGREVDQVDPALVAAVVDGRVIPLGGRAVRITLRSVWISDVLSVWVQVTAAGP